MKTETKNKLYEGMFLVDSSLAGSDWDGINEAIRKILKKAKAEIVSIAKWDDRRLAYDIKGKSRGTYILSYFRVDGGRIKEIEKSVRLSEKIMRVLILSAERFSQEDIEKETPAMKLERGQQEEGEETAESTTGESVRWAKDFGEGEESEAAEQTEQTKQIPEEETGDLEAPDLSSLSGTGMAAEAAAEKQPEQEQFDVFRPADENEQAEP